MTRKPTCVACKGGSGADYTAGDGIVIESNEISADTSVLATKSELPDMNDYQEKLTAGTGISIDSSNVISAGDGVWTNISKADAILHVTSRIPDTDILVRIQRTYIFNDGGTNYTLKCLAEKVMQKGVTFTSLCGMGAIIVNNGKAYINISAYIDLFTGGTTTINTIVSKVSNGLDETIVYSSAYGVLANSAETDDDFVTYYIKSSA